MNDLRTKLAQEWAKKHNIQLSLFPEQLLKEEKTTEREKRLTDKEFKEMCKKARVDQKSLADTVFTRSLKSS
ncbi:hypothetical protein ES695_09580 [Candidatus Atribacteria bacterium 1244-E10-H5-B2]|nr:MAG: hypothetical protein ES695_09580 [Candidatus Atribacteria bacterium 1244-E10-H5-B2]